MIDKCTACPKNKTCKRDNWINIALLVGSAVTCLSALGGTSGNMSTHTYREGLKTQGISVEGMHVDHMVPKNLGGIDNVSNYQLVPAHLNQSWGDGDLIEKTIENPTGMILGLAVTILFPELRILIGALAFITTCNRMNKDTEYCLEVDNVYKKYLEILSEWYGRRCYLYEKN